MSPAFFRAGGRSRKLLAIRVALLVVVLLVTYAFHVSGTALVELRIARLVILVALVGGVAWLGRRRARGQLEADAPKRLPCKPER